MYVKVRAIPGARREQVVEADPRDLTIHVREPARQNLANRRITEILAERYGVPSRAVKMLSGFRSPTKVFSIDV